MHKRSRTMRSWLLMGAAAAGIAVACPAWAQTAAPAPDLSRRVDVIERELRAVQRRVFPGSENGLAQPEVQPANGGTAISVGGSTPVADLSARVDAIESQLARLTEQVEQTGFRQRELDAAVARLRAELGGRLDRLDGGAAAADAPAAPAGPVAVAPTPASSPAPTPTPAPTPSPSATAPRPATTTPTPAPAASATPRPAAAASAPASAERRARVSAIEVPSTGNAAEDAYLYGYRLWDARLYPEAQAQLQKVLADYPQHRRASYAGNLLGRAYLDNNQPTLAVRAFYDNYRERPRGERAADSVYYMGMALIRLDRRADACRTFDEFDRAYGATASAQLKGQVVSGRGQARC